ncbi:hypothetical protein ARMSODRAFT_957274 [Armillaria solidipes]|uniref:Uncharacterized protein n=1 Tax=Armillaria solidipes TaxID=1076256 RepID=A0A2H3BIU0_9AGAR|nr:hypothetical protein ARMSODRAFT_957274 [Armillaria solidipes]
MTLNIKSRESSLPQNTFAIPTLDSESLSIVSKAVGAPSHWADFYQLPVANDITIGTKWIDTLWEVLHRRTPASYHASGSFAFTSKSLSDRFTKNFKDHGLLIQLFIRPHVRTKTLYAIYDILEYYGHLEIVCPGLINDILQEIKDGNSDSMSFSVSLRHRCKIAAPQLERETRMLQKVVIRQHKDLGAHNVPRYFEYLLWGAGALTSVCTLWLLALVLSGTDSDPAFTIFVICVAPPICLIRMMIQKYPRALWLVHDADVLNTNAFQLIWAVRDMAALLTRIAETEGSSLCDVSHAERFLEAFRASFLGGREELSKLRSWLQELPNWTDKNFSAHHWNDHDVASPDNDVP